MRSSLATVFALLLSAAVSAGTAQFPVGFPQLSLGDVILDVPEDWKIDYSPGEGLAGTHYRLTPPGNVQTILLFTPNPWIDGGSYEERCTIIDAQVLSTVRRLREVAEGPVEVQRRDGEAACVRYASAADKTVTEPTAEDFKYATQGILAVGDVFATFTFLTNHPQPPEREVMLGMLSGAQHRKSAVHPRFRYVAPGGEWAVSLDLASCVLETPQTDAVEPRQQMEASCFDDALIVSAFFEPTVDGKTAADYRSDYRSDVLGMRKIGDLKAKRREIRESDRGPWKILSYTNVFDDKALKKAGMAFEQPSLNAFLVHRGLWIDIHLSSVEEPEKAEAMFKAFLDAIEVVD